MSVIEKTITFFSKTLGQDVITLSMHSAQAALIGLTALDGFVVRAAAKGLLVEVWIEDERRDYAFGDYLELLKREAQKAGDEPNPYLDDDYATLLEADDEPNPYADDAPSDDGKPKG